MTNNTVETLNNLITTSKDSEIGFLTAADNASASSFKQIFSNRAAICKQDTKVLQGYVKRLNGIPADSCSMMGALQQGWTNFKLLFTGCDDYTILVECERREEAAIATYEQALEEDLPQDIRLIIKNQYDNVLKSYEVVRDLCDHYDDRKNK